MNDFSFWKKVESRLKSGISVTVLIVVDSNGSSPGRQGFKMGVDHQGKMFGSVGGGIMEQKWVDWVRSKKEPIQKPELKYQVHDKESGANHSGLICSGWQKIVFYSLSENHLQQIENLVLGNEDQAVSISPNHFEIKSGVSSSKYSFEDDSEGNWEYIEKTCVNPRVHIVGGGHVGLACSEIFSFLGFEAIVYDDRPNLNTLVNNQFAEAKVTTSYENLGNIIPEGSREYVVLMTFGYRSDKEALISLIGKEYGYIGMMGSRKKVDTLFEEILKMGDYHSFLQKIYAPIGLSIKSRTPQEIAISVAAEIIKLRNEFLY